LPSRLRTLSRRNAGWSISVSSSAARAATDLAPTGILTLLPFGCSRRGAREPRSSTGRRPRPRHGLSGNQTPCPVGGPVVGWTKRAVSRNGSAGSGATGDQPAIRQGFDISQSSAPSGRGPVRPMLRAFETQSIVVRGTRRLEQALATPSCTRFSPHPPQRHSQLSNLLETVYGLDTDKDHRRAAFLFSGCLLRSVAERGPPGLRQAVFRQAQPGAGRAPVETSPRAPAGTHLPGNCQFIFGLDFSCCRLIGLIGYKLFK